MLENATVRPTLGTQMLYWFNAAPKVVDLGSQMLNPPCPQLPTYHRQVFEILEGL